MLLYEHTFESITSPCRTRRGETEIPNLVELCAFHHRLVHDGGWAVVFDGLSLVTFFRPDGTPLPSDYCTTGSAEPFASDLERRVEERGIDVSSTSVVSKWCGDALDLGLILPAFELKLEEARSRGTG